MTTLLLSFRVVVLINPGQAAKVESESLLSQTSVLCVNGGEGCPLLWQIVVHFDFEIYSFSWQE